MDIKSFSIVQRFFCSLTNKVSGDNVAFTKPKGDYFRIIHASKRNRSNTVLLKQGNIRPNTFHSKSIQQEIISLLVKCP